MWKVNILTTFKIFYLNIFSNQIYHNAKKYRLYKLDVFSIKDFIIDKYNTIDLSPYGDGNSMLMRVDVISDAIQSLFENTKPIIYLSPKGKTFNQEIAYYYSQYCKGVNILCGRFEGVDERIIKKYNIIEVSIGNYVLSSGDIAALVFIDSCLRLLPMFLSNSIVKQESFGISSYSSLLEHSQYTRPKFWVDEVVPFVLFSGNYKLITSWRLATAEQKTKNLRTDLWNYYKIDKMNCDKRYIKSQIERLAKVKFIPRFRAGDTLRVYNRIIEGNNERIQIFEGVCLAVYCKGVSSSFKLKKITKGIVFEKNFPIYSPLIKKVDVIRRGSIRRSKLYYMRQFIGKAARVKEKIKSIITKGE